MKVLDKQELIKMEEENERKNDILKSGWKSDFGKLITEDWNKMMDEAFDLLSIGVGDNKEPTELGHELKVRQDVIRWLNKWWIESHNIEIKNSKKDKTNYS